MRLWSCWTTPPATAGARSSRAAVAFSPKKAAAVSTSLRQASWSTDAMSKTLRVAEGRQRKRPANACSNRAVIGSRSWRGEPSDRSDGSHGSEDTATPSSTSARGFPADAASTRARSPLLSPGATESSSAPDDCRSKGLMRSSGKPYSRRAVSKPSRTAMSSATGSGPSRRATMPSTSAVEGSSQCASSMTTISGFFLASSARTSRAPRPIRKLSGAIVHTEFHTECRH